MNKILKENIEKLEELAKEMKVDFYPMKYEVVPIESMLDVMSYGLPTRARHWRYGQSYDYQKMSGEMGQSKVYELVLNNDPCYAFLLDTNSNIINTMVSAHVLGHCHFFKNNYLFKKTDNKMVYKAAERASRIDDYIDRYGITEVERIMDMAFAMDRNIDWHKGEYRNKYPGVRPFVKNKNKHSKEFIDMFKKNNITTYDIKKFPPYQEQDLLWFFVNYADIEDWKKDVLEIIRQESFYFYPQYLTKIMNEGFAVYVHTELMIKLDVSPTDFVEYTQLHEKVVQSGGNKFNMNPYYLGFRIFKDIESRWDEMHKNGESDITGYEKILEVVEGEDDVSFIRNYLTEELCEDMQLFVYDQSTDMMGNQIVEIKSKDLDDVKEYLTKKLYNYAAPGIVIDNVTSYSIELVHTSSNIGTLDLNHTKKVMTYIYELWGIPVNIQTVSEDQEEVHITLDESGFSI